MSNIGTADDNVAFLEYLKREGHWGVIEKGCVTCRNIGHEYSEACRA